MNDDDRESKKVLLPVALAHGVSIGSWARTNDVPKTTVYRWASEPEVRKAAEACRRRIVDRAVGMMTKEITKAVKRLAWLSAEASSESVSLNATRAIIADMMAVSEHSELEERMTLIEERLNERT